jgi:hypothetical protein
MPPRQNENGTFGNVNVICKAFLRDFVYESHQKNKTELECVICTDPIDCKHCFALLSCGHGFHSFCLMRLNRCPVCRN